MGRVFTPKQLELGIIPRLESFGELLAEIRDRLSSTDGIHGAVLCGSVLSGCHNLRSDVDCLVVYDFKHLYGVNQVFGDLHARAAELHIPLELIPIDTQMAKRRMHSIGPSFAVHLARAAANGGVIKDNPLHMLSDEHFQALADVEGYLRSKGNKIAKGVAKMSIMGDEHLCELLQDLLEAPVHLARKVLWYYNARLVDDSKKTVRELYASVAGKREAKLLEDIRKVDECYSAGFLSHRQIANSFSYRQLLGKIEELAPKVLEFFRLNAFSLS